MSALTLVLRDVLQLSNVPGNYGIMRKVIQLRKHIWFATKKSYLDEAKVLVVDLDKKYL